MNLCRHFQDDAKAMHFVSCMLLKLLADADFQEWHQFTVKANRKETTSVFGLGLTAAGNIDFVTQYLANNRISGDALADFSCKVLYTFL